MRQSIQTELGTITADYWWEDNYYFKQPIGSTTVYWWNGHEWQQWNEDKAAA
jgi:hypothetical protein